LPKSISLIYIIPPPERILSFGETGGTPRSGGGGDGRRKPRKRRRKKHPGGRLTFGGTSISFADEPIAG